MRAAGTSEPGLRTKAGIISRVNNFTLANWRKLQSDEVLHKVLRPSRFFSMFPSSPNPVRSMAARPGAKHPADGASAHPEGKQQPSLTTATSLGASLISLRVTPSHSEHVKRELASLQSSVFAWPVWRADLAVRPVWTSSRLWSLRSQTCSKNCSHRCSHRENHLRNRESRTNSSSNSCSAGKSTSNSTGTYVPSRTSRTSGPPVCRNPACHRARGCLGCVKVLRGRAALQKFPPRFWPKQCSLGARCWLRRSRLPGR